MLRAASSAPKAVAGSKPRRVQPPLGRLDAETCLACANEIAPDDVPSFEAWAHPERRE
jgi:hypothetical protein